MLNSVIRNIPDSAIATGEITEPVTVQIRNTTIFISKI